ncbi:mitochondrial import protein pam17 [Ceraceosorus bombacis]|uniref:Presequence translocated-associated motor subunit PAM17 n=1 Tax=Ceraceosorus bombacis TaxID=401625 RepID=A0A0P1BRJ2_9BASI|nr:mitochondrial import protein pam17 [Ceraceosorus bombacis]
MGKPTIDPSTPGFAGIDPVYLSILGTAACGGLGYLVGPALGNGLWAVVYRAKRKETERMDNEFWKHVVRNRADALGQTMQNRLPDFYAESVTSLSTYRQWLRDQSAFKRKLQHGVEEAQREEQRRAGRSGL